MKNLNYDLPNQSVGEDKDELLKRMFKLMMESLMEGERSAFLGYGKHDFTGYGTSNSRNGYYDRDLLTGVGLLEKLNIPRDRLGEFTSELVDKWERSTKPMDNLVLSLYAKGMSTRDIEDVIKRIYGKDISPQAVTLITKEVEEERLAWERRRLKRRYTAVFIDALFTNIRRESVSSDAVYTIAGIDENGHREILGQYVGTAESALFWKQALADIKDRGVEQVLVFVFDGLAGLEGVVKEIFPRALNQLCVVHAVRNVLSNIRPCHKMAVAGDLKTIYGSKTIQEAKDNALKVKSKWQGTYPRAFNQIVQKIDILMSFLTFPEYIRPHLYTTNWLERLNKEFRKVLKNKNSMPTEDSVRNLLYLKVRDLSRRWETQRLNGFGAYQVDLNILWDSFYGERKEGFTQNS
jgi:transposase-like protein